MRDFMHGTSAKVLLAVVFVLSLIHIFHAEVIDALGVRLFGTLLKFEVPFYHEVAHDKNNSLITLIVGCVFQRQAKVMLQLCFNLFFDRIDRQPVVHKKSSKCPRSIYM